MDVLKICVPEVLGGRGGWGKGDLEKSRFDWVFLNDGLPYWYLIIFIAEVVGSYMDLRVRFKFNFQSLEFVL